MKPRIRLSSAMILSAILNTTVPYAENITHTENQKSSESIQLPDSQGAHIEESASSAHLKNVASGAPSIGGATAGSADAFLHTGAFTYTFPLRLPPAPGGLQPNLSLRYNSSLGMSWVGKGWDLTLGNIEISFKNGLPRFNKEDTFIATVEGRSFELVQLADGTYRPKIDDGWQKFTYSNEKWMLYDKWGTQYQFGQSSASQELVNGKPYRWLLDQIQDRHGNVLYAAYKKTPNQAYLSEISYGKNLNNYKYPIRKIVFLIASPIGQTVSSYRSGELKTLDIRLESIKTYVDDVPAWSYQFIYSSSTLTAAMLLKEIRGFGLDSSTPFPPVRFDYQASNEELVFSNIRNSQSENLFRPNLEYISGDFNGDGLEDYGEYQTGNFSWQSPLYLTQRDGTYKYVGEIPDISPNSVISNKVLTGDFNGDGKSDLLVYRTENSPRGNIYLATGTGSFQKAWSCPGTDFKNRADEVHLGDFNADGLTDVLVSRSIQRKFEPQIFLSTGTGMISGGSLPNTWDRTEGQRVVIGDFDGDGSSDVYLYSTEKNSVGNHGAFLRRGTTFLRVGDIGGEFKGKWDRLLASDLNGDGLTDLIAWRNNSGSPTSPEIFLSRGFRNVIANMNYFQKLTTLSDIGPATEQSEIGLTDLDGDKIPEILAWVQDATQGVSIYRARDHGYEKIAVPTVVKDNPTTNFFLQILPFDSDGDGRAELLVKRRWDRGSKQSVAQYRPIGKSPDLLSQIDNGMGGKIKATYKSSSSGYNRYLPFSFPVIATITTIPDTNPNSEMTQTFDYFSGYFDRKEKEFLGFSDVIAKTVNGGHRTYFFLQDRDHLGKSVPQNYLKGRLYKTNLYDLNGTKLVKSDQTDWEYKTIEGTSVAVRKKRDRLLIPDQKTNFITETEYTYDDNDSGPNYGNVIKTYFKGDLGVAGDERTDLVTYAINVKKYLFGFPSRITTLGSGNEQLQDTMFFYDDSLNGDLITKGNVTETKRWLNKPIEKWVSIKTAWNETGQVIFVTDALGHSIHTSYDIGGFVNESTNPLGFAGRMSHDARSGNLEWEQGINGEKTHYWYDSLGRLTKHVGPSDSIQFPTIEYDYHDELIGDPSKQYLEIKKREQFGQDGTIWSKEYFDGIGRVYRTEKQAPPPHDFIISETLYNKIGEVEKISTPRYANPSTSARWTTYQYDQLGRVIETKRPDNTFSSMQYLGRSVVMRDANGKVDSSVFDYAGRLIQRNEPSVLNATRYTYDVLGNLLSVKDTNGIGMSLAYDSLSRKIESIDPTTGHWMYEYDDSGNLITQEDARGVKIGMSYDSANRLLEKKLLADPHHRTEVIPGTVLSSLTYDEYDASVRPYSKGQLTSVRDLSGAASYYHDRLGRTTRFVKEVDGIFYETKTAYDAIGRITQITYPNDEIVQYEYEQGGRLSKVKDGMGYIYAFIPNYDAFDRYLSYLQSDNKIQTTYSYHPNTDRLSSLSVRLPTTTGSETYSQAYDYDRVGNITVIGDGSLSKPRMLATYDDLYRLKKVTGPSFGEQSYAYDAVGNLIQFNKTLFKFEDSKHPYVPTSETRLEKVLVDSTTLVAWDLSSAEPIYRLTGVVNRGNVSESQTNLVLSGYFNHKLALNLSSGTIATFEYTGLGGGSNVMLSLSVVGATPPALYQKYDFRPFTSQPRELNYQLSSGTYQSFGSLSMPTIASNGPKFTTGVWNEGLSFSGRDIFVVPNTDGFLSKDEFTVMIWANPTEFPSSGLATLIAKEGYFPNINIREGFKLAINSDGNVVFEVGASNTATRVVSLTQLEKNEWTFITASVSKTKIELALNGVVQSSAKTPRMQGSMSPVVLGAQLGAKREIALETAFIGKLDEPRIQGRAWTSEEIQRNLKEFSNMTQYTYDENGNRLSKLYLGDLWTYQYDPENRLTQIKKNDILVATYVYDFNGSRVLKKTSEGKTRYIGNLLEVHPNGSLLTYINAGSLRIAERFRLANGTTQTSFLHLDHLGSTWLRSNQSGVVTDVFEYQPFGQSIRLNNDSISRLYTGQINDPESDLYFYNARYYDPRIARFITPDSFVQDLTDPQSFNRYSYARNNPFLYTDPDGHFFWIPVIIGTVMGGTHGNPFDARSWKNFDYIGSVIGAAAAYAGSSAGNAAFTAFGEGTAGTIAGSIAGGISGGVTGGALNAVRAGGDLMDGIVIGAASGALSGAITGGLASGRMTGVVGSTFGGYLTGYILSGGKPSAGWGSARSGAISSFLSAALTAYTPLDKDYNIAELRNDPERLSQMQNAQTLTVSTPQFNDLGDIQWNAIALLLGGGYSHAWHTQDPGTSPERGYAKHLANGIEHVNMPDRGEYRLFSNNCSTRFGSLHPGHLASRYGYMH